MLSLLLVVLGLERGKRGVEPPPPLLLARDRSGATVEEEAGQQPDGRLGGRHRQRACLYFWGLGGLERMRCHRTNRVPSLQHYGIQISGDRDRVSAFVRTRGSIDWLVAAAGSVSSVHNNHHMDGAIDLQLSPIELGGTTQ